CKEWGQCRRVEHRHVGAGVDQRQNLDRLRQGAGRPAEVEQGGGGQVDGDPDERAVAPDRVVVGVHSPFSPGLVSTYGASRSRSRRSIGWARYGPRPYLSPANWKASLSVSQIVISSPLMTATRPWWPSSSRRGNSR